MPCILSKVSLFCATHAQRSINIPAKTTFFFPILSKCSLKSVSVKELGCRLWMTYSRAKCQPQLLSHEIFLGAANLLAFSFQFFEFLCKLGSWGEKLEGQSVATEKLPALHTADYENIPAHPAVYRARRAQHRRPRRGTSSVHRQ